MHETEENGSSTYTTYFEEEEAPSHAKHSTDGAVEIRESGKQSSIGELSSRSNERANMRLA